MPVCFSNVSSNFDNVSCYCGASFSAAFLSGDTEQSDMSEFPCCISGKDCSESDLFIIDFLK